jgi:hypothetical protein
MRAVAIPHRDEAPTVLELLPHEFEALKVLICP